MGIIISGERIVVDPIKSEIVFVGKCVSIRGFVKGFAKTVAPLMQLARKDHPFTWTENCEDNVYP